MTDWLFDTLLWTAALIALVLLVRRPVARWFGPQMAYALWALPVMRLFLPPIQLPAWLAPMRESAPEQQATTLLIHDPATPFATHEAVAGSMEAASGPASPFTPLTLIESGPWLEIGLVAWLAGAAIFLYLRFAAYFRLRAELLDNAREVGKSGRIRLVETSGTEAPLAFGVIDPVIAVPQGFMAQPDREARDLALAHEFTHHRGHDLLINVMVQPLFAMHWFNPLARYGWLALRRDQEAACDARVVASKPADERAAYASVIAGFAAGPNVALAAPMACPVLGDKSIIQRLRSLNMSDLSPRRRVAGRALMGAALLALPLTASISYAEAPVPAAPNAPKVSAAVPAPPAAPLAPAPLAVQSITAIDPDTGEEINSESERVVIMREVDEDNDGKTETRVERKVQIINKGEKMSEEEMEAKMAELREGLAEADKVMKDLPKIIENAMVDIDMDGQHGRTVVKMECRGNSDEVATVEEAEGQVRKVYLCQSRVMAEAVKGLKEARKAISKNREMNSEMREQMLEELDRQIREWEKREG